MHSNSFNFHGFPPNILKQFQEIVEAMQEFDDDPQNSQRQKFFENKYNDFRQKTDQDLDGKLYADQLDTLLKRISPELMPKQKTPSLQAKVKLSDEEKIMDIIHGTYREEVAPVKPRKRQVQKIPASPHHFGGLPPFDLPPSSGRQSSWQSKTVMTIRKPDGSYETRKTERTQDGQMKTITKTGPDGTSSTQSFTGDAQTSVAIAKPQQSAVPHEERNLVETFDGYKIPCLW